VIHFNKSTTINASSLWNWDHSLGRDHQRNVTCGNLWIVGGVMLALGRAMGETMAVTMIIGNSNNFSFSLLAPGNTISAMLANQFGEADGSQVSSLMYAAFVLIIMTLAVNILAQLLVKRLSLKY
jgi:phosphate transport system permease protein